MVETIDRECVVCGKALFIEIEAETDKILSGGEYFGKSKLKEAASLDRRNDGEYWECRECYEEDDFFDTLMEADTEDRLQAATKRADEIAEKLTNLCLRLEGVTDSDWDDLTKLLSDYRQLVLFLVICGEQDV